MPFKSESSKRFFLGGMIILVGVMLLLNEFNVLDFKDLWPLIIIAVGVWFILKPERGSGDAHHKSGIGDQTYVTDAQDVIESNTFGDIKVNIKSQNFKSGRISTSFGDVKVDLTELKVQSGEQILRLNTTFGDIKIAAPKDTAFALQASNTAGDMRIFEDKRSGWQQRMTFQSEGYDKAENRLKIISSQIFGDLKVW